MAYPMIMVFVGIGGRHRYAADLRDAAKCSSIFKEIGQDPAHADAGAHPQVSGFLHDYWWAFLLVAHCRWRGSFSAVTSRPIRAHCVYHTMLLKIPKLGDLILKREIAGFTRTLGSLLRNGVPILNALSISAEVMTIRPIRDEIAKIPEGITQGAGIAPTLRNSPLFPPVVVNMVAIGEETGHLPEVLLRVAESYEMQVDRSIKMLTSIIEPVIILIMGIVVGSIVIAMLLPIFSLDPTAGMGE